jgi:hypothetical protein
MKTFRILFILLVTVFQTSFAQDDAALNAKMQFSSLFLGTNNNFKEVKGDQYNEDENFTYYGSEYGLGDKAVTILKSKKDTTTWYCYIKFSLETELEAVLPIQTGTFELLNMLITGGKIRGTEETEGGITRTDLYVKSNDAWLGELVTDGDKKTFHILLKNTPWQ